MKAEKFAQHVAESTIAAMLPHIESTSKVAAMEAAEHVKKVFMLEISGEDYENRAAVRGAIQWAIKSSRRSYAVLKLTAAALISSGVAFLFAYLFN